jgi:hypothetical protein
MTTFVSPPEQAIQETMAKLEAALLAPVVSGELQAWIRQVQQAATTFGTDWACYLHSVLHVQYAEIAGTDPELLGRVEQMVKTDQQLLEDFARLQEELHELGCRAQKVDKHESKLAEHRQRLEDFGIKIIVNIKKQQAAAVTWLGEALYRDRGVGD